MEGLVLGVIEALRKRYKNTDFEGDSKLILAHINEKISQPSWEMMSKISQIQQANNCFDD
jgi:hypothetical protein